MSGTFDLGTAAGRSRRTSVLAMSTGPDHLTASPDDEEMVDPLMVFGIDHEGPLQRLDPQGGAGVPLAAAAADVARYGDRYTSQTQIATVLAYHLMEYGSIASPELASSLVGLHDRPKGSLYVDLGPATLDWLDRSLAGPTRPMVAATVEPAGWIAPLAVWFLDDVDAMVRSVTEVVAMVTLDAPSVVTAGIAVGAIAGASMLMTGQDLVLGAAETGMAVFERLTAHRRFNDLEVAERIPPALDDVKAAMRSTSLEVEALLARAGVPDRVLPVLQAIVVGADGATDGIRRIELACALGPEAAVVVGAMVGGQGGLRRWPWRVSNETWFAEIGRRLQARNAEFRDLPIPYAVEERMRIGDASEHN